MQKTFGAILEFTGEHEFLSNFYQGTPIGVHGMKFRTGEHMFQSVKPNELDARETLRTSCITPGQAKARGRMCVLRLDWEAVKHDVMRATLVAKFQPNRPEYDLLMATGDRYLAEGNWWNDRVWGVDLNMPIDPPGRNWLGHLLMARRAELQSDTRVRRSRDEATLAYYVNMYRGQ